MEKAKELIQNKKILAIILIVCVGILFVAVVVSNSLGKSRQAEDGVIEASNTDCVKKVHTEDTKSEKNTETEKKTELETDIQGNISSVVVENDEMKEESSQYVTNVKETVSVSENHSSQTQGNISSDKGEEVTERQEENTEAIPSVSQNTQPSNNGQQQPSSEPVTVPAPQPPVSEPPAPQPTECQHTSTTRKVTTAATESSHGAWATVCNGCGTTLETGSIHAYGAHSVDIGGGQTTTVYGYFDDEIADEVFKQLNTYRQENGLYVLENRFHEESKIRAMECAYLFNSNHDRPNGQELWELNELIGVENIAYMANGIMLSIDTPASLIATTIMNGWKNSEGHNANMLTECELGGVGVFVKIIVDSDGIANRESIYATQNFGTEY